MKYRIDKNITMCIEFMCDKTLKMWLVTCIDFCSVQGWVPNKYVVQWVALYGLQAAVVLLFGIDDDNDDELWSPSFSVFIQQNGQSGLNGLLDLSPTVHWLVADDL